MGVGAKSCRGFPAFLGSLRRRVGAVTVPGCLHESILFASVLSDAGRTENNERGLGNPSLCREKMPQALRGHFSSTSWHFYPSYLAGKVKIKELGQIAFKKDLGFKFCALL